jgi:asparagine synthase (glutamine-hydrolysing)
MCGFAGFVSAAPDPDHYEQRADMLRRMGRQLALRGPDDEQLIVDDHISLLFRRLSIVDCAGGRQPIANEDRTLFLAINGEIYNHDELHRELRGDHRFVSRSDSEIVLHLYEERGPAALQALIGMFAIAIWDAARRQLFLARDRLGIKPLYYSRRARDLMFGSEVKALLAHPDCSRQFNWSDWVPEPDRLPTFVRGIDALPAGHYLTWNARGEFTSHCYWNLDDALTTPDRGLTAEHYIERFADLFEDSVSLRLMADVPVGAFLSGGLDSSAMVAAAAAKGQALPCFSILEKTTVLCGDARAAADVAARIDAPLYSVVFDHATLADQLRLGLEHFEYFVWLMDYPLFTLEFLFKHELHRFVKTAMPAIKVILIGQGADEFAGGYSNGLNKTHAGWDDYLTTTVAPTWRASRRALLGIPESFAAVLAPDAYGTYPNESPFSGEMKLRLRTLQSFNLWHEDRTSAGQGIEARVPYLDHRLVELLASVPPRLHPELFWDKEIIRRAARRWLPEALVRRPKVPFVYAPNRASTVDFIYRWLATTFPKFREKYDGPDRLFDGSVLAALLRVAAKQPERRENAVRQLTQCMAISVFERMCREGPPEVLDRWRPPSPLARGDALSPPWSLDEVRAAGAHGAVE